MEGEVGNCFNDILRVLSALWSPEDYCSEIIFVLEGVLYSLFRQRRIREVVQLSAWLMTARLVFFRFRTQFKTEVFCEKQSEM